MRSTFGYIWEKLEIKILMLFIMRRLNEAVSFDELTELTLCDDEISYFDYMECIADLIKTDHINFCDGKYSLTDKGMRNGEITEKSLPFTVKMYVENITFSHRGKQNRNEMIKTFHKINPAGNCTVELSMSDGLVDVVSIELFAINEKQAVALEKGFRKNAESIYNHLIENILAK